MADDAEDTLLEQARAAVLLAVKDVGVGVAFSGGVDSSLVARICADEGLEPTLLTVGTPGSRDMRFAAHVASLMSLPHRPLEISAGDIAESSRTVNELVGDCSLSWRENCVAFHHVARLASSLGLAQIVTANGIDELFCGYSAYRKIAGDAGLVGTMMRDKVDSEVSMMRAVAKMTRAHNVEIVQPLLGDGFVAYAMGVPLADKITGEGDLMRKHIVRRAAVRAGVPTKAALSRKKALQYGSGIHAVLRR